MKIGLASDRFQNKNITFNLSQIEKALQESQGKVDLLCFCETFLQGFDSLCWDYQADKTIAIDQDGVVMDKLCNLTIQYKTDLLIGYVERAGDALYSSCAVIAQGELIHNYRRISKNWKEYNRTDCHYCEGTATCEFLNHGKRIMICLYVGLKLFPELH